MKKHGIPSPDILITSLGTRIQYGQELTEDDLWADHIDYDWSVRRIRQALSSIKGLLPQEQKHQTAFKISYYYNPQYAPSPEELTALLRQQEISAHVIVSFGQFLDVIPARASKGQALRYVAQRMEIPLEHMLVAGGSGADEDMMRGNTLAVVVATRHHEELSLLPSRDRIYFAQKSYAAGLLEAMDHYDFFGRCEVPDA
jgi:sucrose-phosphate synthase